MNEFMGSIHGSLFPNEERLARHCRDLAINVRALTDLGRG